MDAPTVDQETTDRAAFARHRQLDSEAQAACPVSPNARIDPYTAMWQAGYWSAEADHAATGPDATVLAALCLTSAAAGLAWAATQIEALRWFNTETGWPSHLDVPLERLGAADPEVAAALASAARDLSFFALRSSALDLVNEAVEMCSWRPTEAAHEAATVAQACRDQFIADTNAVAHIGGATGTPEGRLRPEVVYALVPLLRRLDVTAKGDKIARWARFETVGPVKEAENNIKILLREPCEQSPAERTWFEAHGK